MQLGRFFIEKFADGKFEDISVPIRLRMAFEQLGPTFVKLGQLLASRPDLIPKEFVEEFKKLHDNVKPVPFNEIKQVLDAHYDSVDKVFQSFEETPLASASIAQVHKATLKDGTDVVVKVQRPGIIRTIEEDLTVLYNMAGLLDHYVPETRVYNPEAIVDEFFKTLELETNFVVEANNISRFASNFRKDPNIIVPKVYTEFSGQKVLVLEFLKGTPLSRVEQVNELGINKKEFIHQGIHTFFKMVFLDRFFHGDLHAGNLFIMPGGVIGLIDFGVVGRLSERVRDSIADMFLALANEDYDRLAQEFIELAPYNEYTSVHQFSQDLRDLIAPHFGLTFKNVNTGKILLEATSIAARHNISVPSELMLFFKAIVAVEGMGRSITDDYDILSEAVTISTEILKAKYDPKKISKDLIFLAKDSSNLLYSLPSMIKLALRRVNSPTFARKVSIEEIDSLKKSIESSSQLMFLGIVIGSLILGSALIAHNSPTARLSDLPFLSYLGYIGAFLLGAVAFYKFIRRK
jgi:ubiquinone biosynthesis protein